MPPCRNGTVGGGGEEERVGNGWILFFVGRQCGNGNALEGYLIVGGGGCSLGQISGEGWGRSQEINDQFAPNSAWVESGGRQKRK